MEGTNTFSNRNALKKDRKGFSRNIPVEVDHRDLLKLNVYLMPNTVESSIMGSSSVEMENEYQLKNQRREISRNLPDEVLFEEILVRLPVKTLTIYKSVCKEWLYRIESRSFREVHRRRHIRYYSDQIMFSPFKSVSDPVTKSSSLLPSTHSFRQGLVKMTSIPLDVMLPPDMTRLNWPDVELADWSASVCVLGPVRTTGIYCVIVYLFRKNLYAYLPSAKISICNPATRDYKLANPFPPDETARLLDFTTRQHCNVSYGFGLAADGDYKVVVVVNWGRVFSGFLSYVYSMKQGAWKKIVDSENAMVSRLDLRGKPHFPDIRDRWGDLLCPQVFLNGCWHWMASFSDDTSNVLSFDLDKEVFKLVQGPPSYRGADMTGYEGGVKVTSGVVSVLNDHLTALYYTCYSLGPLIDGGAMVSVWMMKEYDDEESWINVWTVNLEESIVMESLVGISYSLREDGIHIASILLQDSNQQLFLYDRFGVSEEQHGYDTSSCIFWNTLGISAYSETLEPL